MTFTRTPAGIANYKIFHRVDIIAYTEGKSTTTDPTNASTPDEIFYKALLSRIYPGSRIKVKSVGNKMSALDYADIIEKNGSKQTFVIVDRDFSDITHSLLQRKCVIRTRGYSWENDLWSSNTCKVVADTLSFSGSSFVDSRFKSLARRLKALGVLDASLQVFDKCLLAKNGSSFGGVAINFENCQPISAAEIKRMFLKFKMSRDASCPVHHAVLKKAAGLPFNQVVQGHLWSNAIRSLIGWSYRKVMNETPPSYKAMLNIALHALNNRIYSMLGKAGVSYYRRAFSRALA